MKQTFLLITLLLATFFAIGQAQQGFVKTKGRLDAQGKLIPGQGLKGATVSVQGRTAVLVKSLDIRKKVFGEEHQYAVQCYNNIGAD